MKSPKHLAWIRTLSCLICGDQTSVEAAHVRYADPSVGKPESGMGRKPSDAFVVPLCSDCHREQHKGSEHAFWNHYRIDPNVVALALWHSSEDIEIATVILNFWKPK